MGDADRGVFASSATVTVLFTDVVGSTELLDREGEEVAADTMRRHFALLREAVHAEGGQEVKSLGDGLMVVFRSALAAVRAGVAMQKALDESADAGDAVLGLRVGIHCGEAAPVGDDWQGGAVVIASRLCSVADRGEIVCSDVVRQLVGRGFGLPFVSRGPLLLKGLSEPVPAHEVVWQAPAAGGDGGDADDDTASVPMPAPLVVTEAQPFVGRGRELERLADAWEQVTTAPARHPRLVLLSGTAGIGKSTLARHFAMARHDEGVTVLFGRCDPDPVVPFQPFAEAVRNLPLVDVVRRLPSAVRGELARLAPELGGGGGRRGSADPDLDRFALFDAVGQLFASLADPEPFVFVVDDLHWARDATLLLVRHLFSQEPPVPFLVVATARDDEPDDHGLSTLVAHLRRADRLERVPIIGLDADDVRLLVEARGRDARVATTVFERSAGNPFFVGALLDQLGGEGGAGAADSLPEGVLDVLGERLDRLSPDTRAVLEAGAVVGPTFDATVVAEVCELDDRKVADAVDEAIDARLVEEVADAPGALTFGHQLVRECLTTRLRATRRTLLHHRVADAIERRHGTGPGRWAGDLAHHRIQSGTRADTGDVLWACLAAAKAAMTTSAYELAVERLEQALSVAEARDVDTVERVPILLALSHALGAAGRRDRARSVASDVVAASRAAGRADWQAEAALAVAGPGGEIAVADPEIDALLVEATSLEGVPAGLRVQLLSRLAQERLGGDALESARTLGYEALAVAERLRDPWTTTAAAVALRYALSGPDHLHERVMLGERVHELRALDDDEALRFRALRAESLDQLELGEVDAFDRMLGELVALAEKLRQPRNLWVTNFTRAGRALYAGDLAEAEQLAGHAFAMGIEAQVENALPTYAIQLYGIRREQGRLMELAGQAAEVQSGRRQFLAGRVLRAALDVQTGGAREALEELTPEFFDRLPRDVMFLGALSVAAELLPAIDDREVAVTLRRLLEPFADRTLVVAYGALVLGPMRRLLGVIAWHLDELDLAESELTQAIDEADARGAVLAGVTGRVELSGVLFRRGGTAHAARAREVASVALQGAVDKDLVVLAERARRLTRRDG